MSQKQTETDMLPDAVPDPIVEANVAELRERSRIGQAKYGCTLESVGTLPSARHGLEESLDRANYDQALYQRLQRLQTLLGDLDPPPEGPDLMDWLLERCVHVCQQITQRSRT